jgi:hypothetical protein
MNEELPSLNPEHNTKWFGNEESSLHKTIMCMDVLFTAALQDSPLPKPERKRGCLAENEQWEEAQHESRLASAPTTWRNDYIALAMKRGAQEGAPISRKRALQQTEQIIWDDAVGKKRAIGTEENDEEDPQAILMMRAHKDNASFISITPCMAAMQLHSMGSVGIDADAGRSISTNINDFMFLGTSEEAKSSISVRGIGGNGSKVGGRARGHDSEMQEQR